MFQHLVDNHSRFVLQMEDKVSINANGLMEIKGIVNFEINFLITRKCKYTLMT